MSLSACLRIKPVPRRPSQPGRDYTVATLFQILEENNGLRCHALDAFVDHGSRHFEDIP